MKKASAPAKGTDACVLSSIRVICPRAMQVSCQHTKGSGARSGPRQRGPGASPAHQFGAAAPSRGKGGEHSREHYLEHYGATPGDRRTDSVSSYGRLYNLIWFNNGYHQEHHFRPQVHWTRVPEVKSLLPPESERRTVRGAHWFNFAPRTTPAAAAGYDATASQDASVRQVEECVGLPD